MFCGKIFLNEEFETVIRRDFEDKARPETEIVARLVEGGYRQRYWLLRDLAGHLFWIDRYAMTMYERRPTRWRDVPRQRADVFLPRLIDVDAGPAADALQTGYRGLPPGSDERTEDVLHQVAPDEAGRIVCETVRMTVVRGAQQKRGRIHRAA